MRCQARFLDHHVHKPDRQLQRFEGSRRAIRHVDTEDVDDEEANLTTLVVLREEKLVSYVEATNPKGQIENFTSHWLPSPRRFWQGKDLNNHMK